jgi:YegS/Rv2252/BmrU family lipid kinase
MSGGGPVLLLVNPAAGGGRALRVLPAVEARLRALGVAFSTRLTRDLAHARDLAAGAAHAGVTVVVLSGDGVLGAVAGALREVPGAVLGVLPGGKGNDFARMAGLPLEAEAACAVVAGGAARPVDVGDAGGRTFVGIASLGFDSDANRFADALPARLGRAVYVVGALRALARWRPAGFEVEVDGERVAFRGWSVAAANSGAYGGGMRLAPEARMDDGRLDVVLWSATGRATLLRVLPKVYRGTHVDEPFVRILRGEEIRVSADRPFTVYADGEPVGELPMVVRAVPGAVRVLLPR